MTIWRLSVALCLAIVLPYPLLPKPAVADDAETALRRAEGLYRRGQFDKAYAQLEAAAATIGRALSERFARSFPAAPAGWQARPVTSSVSPKMRLGRGMQLARLYVQTGGTGVARAQLQFGDRFVMAELVENRRILAARKSASPAPVEIPGGGTAFMNYRSSSRDAYIALLIGDTFAISVHVNRTDRPDAIARQILSGWDFAALRKAGGLK